MGMPKKMDSVSDSFVVSFKERFKTKFKECNIDWNNYLFCEFSFTDDGPMTSNHKAKIIYYYPNSSKNLQLNEEEEIALLAHEIGHLVDTTEVLADGSVAPSPTREYNADEFATNLGLGQDLLSAICKIKKNRQVFPEDRIDRLSSYLDNKWGIKDKAL